MAQELLINVKRAALLPMGAGSSTSGSEAAEADAEKIKNIFQRYDLNNDGFIKHDELWQVLSKLCPTLTKEEVDKLFAKMDTNKDQRIQPSEFVDFIFSFADLGDAAEMKMREATASMDQHSEEDAKYRASGSSPLQNSEPDLRLKKTDTTMSTFTLDIGGEEPDLPDLLSSLRAMNAQALREVFQRTDVSKRGFLQLNDIRRVLFPSNVQSESDNLAVVKVFAQMDKNSDGKVHCGEFVSYILEGKRRVSRTASAADKRQMATAFAKGDANAYGRISMEEFERLFGAQTDFDREMLRNVFESVDQNQDGAVSIVELAEVYGKELIQEAKGITVSGAMDGGDEASSDGD